MSYRLRARLDGAPPAPQAETASALAVPASAPAGSASAKAVAACAEVVTLRGAVALLDGFPALSGADLDLGTGQVLVIAGPNGAGKSTLLRLCAGLLPLAAGTGRVLGFDLAGQRRDLRRRVAMVGHATQLYADLTVEENVSFLLRASGGDRSEVHPALERLGLTGRLASTRTAALSAGQRKRTALAAAYARDPRLWLLDEPHAGLDPDGREVLNAVVAEVVARGAAVILVTHQEEIATAMAAPPLAARRVTMRGGRILHSAAREVCDVA